MYTKNYISVKSYEYFLRLIYQFIIHIDKVGFDFGLKWNPSSGLRVPRIAIKMTVDVLVYNSSIRMKEEN